jgi:large subunit ribosomal protein L24
MHALKQRNTRKVRKEIKTVRANKNIRKGDIVQVIACRAFNKTGKVLKIFTQSNRCLVEKVNMMKKHRKPTQQTPGGIDEKEASIHLSNVDWLVAEQQEAKASGSKKTAAKAESKTERKQLPKKQRKSRLL